MPCGSSVLLITALDGLVPVVLDRVLPDLVPYNASVGPHVDDQLRRLTLTDAGLAERERLVLAACRSPGLPHEAIMGLPAW